MSLRLKLALVHYLILNTLSPRDFFPEHMVRFRLGHHKEVTKCNFFSWVNVLATEIVACQVENVIDYFRVDILADLLEELNEILSADP